MIRNKIFVFAVLATLALFNVSCKKSNGGGFIASSVPGGNGKATIGFQLKCDNILHSSGKYVAQVTGNVQYNDHPAGVKVHGDLDFIPYNADPNPDSILTSCEAIAALVDGVLPLGVDGTFAMGTYSNNAGHQGRIDFLVGQQIGEAPPNAPLYDGEVCPAGKGFLIKLEGYYGAAGDYINQGCLDGGNLTIF